MAPTPAKATRLRETTVARLLKRHRIRRFDAAAVLDILRRPSLKVADGVTEAAVLHLRSLITRLRLANREFRTAEKKLDELCTALHEEGFDQTHGLSDGVNHDLPPLVTRATTTPAVTCTGAQRRDFLLGIRPGQPAGAQVQSWASGNRCKLGSSRRVGPPSQATTSPNPARSGGTGANKVGPSAMLAPSMPVSSSALPARPPQPSWRTRARISRSVLSRHGTWASLTMHCSGLHVSTNRSQNPRHASGSSMSVRPACNPLPWRAGQNFALPLPRLPASNGLGLQHRSLLRQGTGHDRGGIIDPVQTRV